MLNSSSIVELYTNVLFNDMSQYGISDESVRVGIESMKEVYKPNNASQTADRSTVADFNDIAHRCAYLHKYAALHTAMVRDKLYEAIHYNTNFFHQLIFSEDCFKICSLGGGPGSDIIGVLAALYKVYSSFPSSVTVVDYMIDWSYSFHSILNELGTGKYGEFGNNTSHLLQWRYVGANLLKSLTPEVEQKLKTASLVTMIKFVSAASCKDTEFMVKNIFKAMKPGAVLFFIDNDGGGYRELIMRAAKKYNFSSIFGPYLHEQYSNELVRAKRFGSVSCFKTIVSIHILQKPILHGSYVSVPGMHCSRYTGYPERRVPFENLIIHTRQDCFNPSFAGDCTPLPQESYTRNVTLNNNYYSPYQSTPLTPCVFQLNSGISTPDPRDSNYQQPGNMQLPNGRFLLMTPETPRAPRRGCIPFSRVKNWRHNFTSRFNTFKSRVNNALKVKSKRNNKKGINIKDKS